MNQNRNLKSRLKSKMEDDNRFYDYHKHNLVYIGDQIKFADGKATLAIGANLVMLGFFGQEAKKLGFSDWSLTSVGLLVGIVLLSLAAYFFIWKVLWPRYPTDTNLYMSWGGIGSMRNSQEYIDFIRAVPFEKFLEDMGHQNYSLSVVCLKKYKNLKYGFTALTAGAIISSVCWLIN